MQAKSEPKYNNTTFNLAYLCVNIPNSVSFFSLLLIKLENFHYLPIQHALECLLPAACQTWMARISSFPTGDHSLTWKLIHTCSIKPPESNLNKVLWGLRKGSISAWSLLGRTSIRPFGWLWNFRSTFQAKGLTCRVFHYEIHMQLLWLRGALFGVGIALRRLCIIHFRALSTLP